MKTEQSTTARGRHDHPPQPVQIDSPRIVRRVGVVDRAALHLGVALIKWGRRRSIAVEPRELQARLVEQEIARQERERAAERWLLLNLHVRR